VKLKVLHKTASHSNAWPYWP